MSVSAVGPGWEPIGQGDGPMLKRRVSIPRAVEKRRALPKSVSPDGAVKTIGGSRICRLFHIWSYFQSQVSNRTFHASVTNLHISFCHNALSD